LIIERERGEGWEVARGGSEKERGKERGGSEKERGGKERERYACV